MTHAIPSGSLFTLAMWPGSLLRMLQWSCALRHSKPAYASMRSFAGSPLPACGLSTQPAAAGCVLGAAAAGAPGAAVGVLAAGLLPIGAAAPLGVQPGAVEGGTPLMAADVPEMICLWHRTGTLCTSGQPAGADKQPRVLGRSMTCASVSHSPDAQGYTGMARVYHSRTVTADDQAASSASKQIQT